jgi:hypothetical protein
MDPGNLLDARIQNILSFCEAEQTKSVLIFAEHELHTNLFLMHPAFLLLLLLLLRD